MAVLAADATSLKNRGLAFAFTSSPYMITAFAGSKASEAFLKNVNWRWGFGCFAIIVPAVALPLFAMLKLQQRKAEKQGVFVRERSGRTILQSIWHGIKEFDGEHLNSADFPYRMLICLPLNSTGSLPLCWRSYDIPSTLYPRYSRTQWLEV